MKVLWEVVEPPLSPVAVAGPGTVGDALAAKATQRGLRQVVRFAGWTVVVDHDLPWVDGVTYLGQLPGTTDVLVPVLRRPRLHPDLVAAAVRSLTGEPRGRVALVPEDPHGTDRVAVLALGTEP